MLGAGGTTKHKIGRAAGAKISLDGDRDSDKWSLTMQGKPDAVSRAEDYVRCVCLHRVASYARPPSGESETGTGR